MKKHNLCTLFFITLNILICADIAKQQTSESPFIPLTMHPITESPQYIQLPVINDKYIILELIAIRTFTGYNTHIVTNAPSCEHNKLICIIASGGIMITFESLPSKQDIEEIKKNNRSQKVTIAYNHKYIRLPVACLNTQLFSQFLRTVKTYESNNGSNQEASDEHWV